jgi:hypothetical protein
MNIPRSVNRATNGLFNSTKPFTAPAAAPLRLLVLIAVCLMAGNLVLADNTVTIGGSGRQSANVNMSGSTGGTLDLYQVGPLTVGAENQAGVSGNPITQTGTGHTVRIGQGATYSKNAWVPGSAVQNNIAKVNQSVNQSGASGDNAAIYQTTSNNTADVTQTGSSQQVTVTQSDSTGNSATISQTGAGQVASITQNGSASSTMSAVLTGAIPLTVIQTGAGGHTATLDASGGSLLSVNQEGTSNKATVTGMTGGSATINQTGVRGELTLSEQSGGSLSVSQSGSNSALGINASGFSSSLSVTQTGNGGTTSFNPVTLPSGISITSTPPKNP